MLEDSKLPTTKTATTKDAFLGILLTITTDEGDSR